MERLILERARDMSDIQQVFHQMEREFNDAQHHWRNEAETYAVQVQSKAEQAIA